MFDMDSPIRVFDAVLLPVGPEEGRARFVAGGIAYRVELRVPIIWPPGTIGLLQIARDCGEVSFRSYPDQRLRRAQGDDDLAQRLWGWTLEDRRFRVRAGVIPGLAGVFVPDLCQPLELPIPPELIIWCNACGLTPADVLRAFIADLSRIVDSRRCPREDGYCSGGSDARFLAREYFLSAHPGSRGVTQPPVS
jgi:hypothetical protein